MMELKAETEYLLSRNTCLFTHKYSIESHSKHTKTRTNNKFRPLAEIEFNMKITNLTNNWNYTKVEDSKKGKLKILDASVDNSQKGMPDDHVLQILF